MEKPVSGTRAGSTSRLTGCVEAVEMRKVTRMVADVVSFMTGTSFDGVFDSSGLLNNRTSITQKKWGLQVKQKETETGE